MTTRWLSIIGIGEDGRDGLTPAASALLDAAGLIVGGKRHLDLVGETRGEKRPWATPLDATIPYVLEKRDEGVCVLASGDPFWFGAGVTLCRHIPASDMLVIPAPSSFSLAAARMGWALQDTVTLGLNMRGLTPLIRPHLHDKRRILALSLNAETPADVARLLTENGFGGSRLTILEAIGGPREKISTSTAATFGIAGLSPLNIMAVDVVAGPNAKPLPLTPGLADDLFEHDGQITKREIRSVTLSSLAPQPGQLLWDIGLGSGSISIEWLLSHPAMRAIGIERDGVRAARAARNAVALGVPHLRVEIGDATTVIGNLDAPDTIFLGGGATTPGLIDECWSRLKNGGRMMANAVTIETESRLAEAFASYGGSLTRLSIDRAERVGGMHGWRAAMPVVQWVAIKR